ncbi:hypothetical protein M0R45_027436 [Rubus argutus]|uniref:Uncharacterized protein n=1 Tax=Rubus argutus TaxID=59490 RepID=A0AAW1X0D8_RUBAR
MKRSSGGLDRRRKAKLTKIWKPRWLTGLQEQDATERAAQAVEPSDPSEEMRLLGHKVITILTRVPGYQLLSSINRFGKRI